MRKLEFAEPDVMRIAIQQEIARSDESRYDHRLHGLLLITGGHGCQQVADLFGEDGSSASRCTASMGCARASGRADRRRWMPGNGRASHASCGAIPGNSGMRPACVTANCSPSTCGNATA